MSGDESKSKNEERAGIACYEGFVAAMREWMPAQADWSTLSEHVRQGWIAAAKAGFVAFLTGN